MNRIGKFESKYNNRERGFDVLCLDCLVSFFIDERNLISSNKDLDQFLRNCVCSECERKSTEKDLESFEQELLQYEWL